LNTQCCTDFNLQKSRLRSTYACSPSFDKHCIKPGIIYIQQQIRFASASLQNNSGGRREELSIPRVPKGLFQRRHAHLDPPLRAMRVALRRASSPTGDHQGLQAREPLRGEPPCSARHATAGSQRGRAPPGGVVAAWTPGLKREGEDKNGGMSRGGGGAAWVWPHWRAVRLGPHRSRALGACRMAPCLCASARPA
jgi:hypothetical protein